MVLLRYSLNFRGIMDFYTKSYILERTYMYMNLINSPKDEIKINARLFEYFLHQKIFTKSNLFVEK
jgi:hypothetical protein